MAQDPSPDRPFSQSQLNSTDLTSELCIQTDRNHPQHTSTCPRCQESMNRQFDNVLRTVMLREGWTEDQVNAVSLRGFATKAMAELAPDASAGPLEVQRQVYARNCVDELQARIDATREVHKARINEPPKGVVMSPPGPVARRGTGKMKCQKLL
ncbi:hypothetical protein CLCR_06393 [Cladophialophora carrionii]|uniref:Uncharacterized protein n=1 Tax=Cladophialophora carrionii TaxID=86049 RepID=A0A1C1C745_9EURO|nr:hypothetical protein CLCR_06393 [Cladophialophora carrionii]